MSLSPSGPPVGGPAALLVLVSRGILLWLVVPVAVLTWLIALSWRNASRIELGQCVGWFDLNLWAVLQRFVFGLLIREPSIRYVPWRDMPEVAHRVRILQDLW